MDSQSPQGLARTTFRTLRPSARQFQAVLQLDISERAQSEGNVAALDILAARYRVLAGAFDGDLSVAIKCKRFKQAHEHRDFVFVTGQEDGSGDELAMQYRQTGLVQLMEVVIAA
jgi:hypothetical protein